MSTYSESTVAEAILVRGPQDGARVKFVGAPPPHVHVGPKWLGDGYAAWSRKPSARFPAVYMFDGDKGYIFAGWHAD